MNNCGSAMNGEKSRRRGVLRLPGRTLRAATAVVAFAAVDVLVVSGSPRSVQPAAFDLQALGAKQHQLPAVDTPAFEATISSHGYTTGAGKRAVSVSAVGAGNGAWTRHAHGVTRRTPYG